MKILNLSVVVRAIAILLLAIGLFSGAEATEKTSPRETVLAFNNFITAGDVRAAMAELADGGVQFTLRSLHEGMNPDTLTAGLVKHWSTIVPVVLASTSSYLRQVEVFDVQANGDVATVWVSTTTESIRLNSEDKSTNSFTEVYLLIDTPNGWKIAANADNRQSTKIAAVQE